MSDYSNELALELQEAAFNGDVDACLQLCEFMRGCVFGNAKTYGVDVAYYEDVWQDCVMLFTQRIASNNKVKLWYAWCKNRAYGVVMNYVRAESRRKKREQMYIDRLNTRYNEAYPELNQCVSELEPLENELIQRMYYRPVRQNMAEFSREMGKNYYWVVRFHKHVLDTLRYMLVERGITHA